MLSVDPVSDIDRLAEHGAQKASSGTPCFIPIDLCRSGRHYVLSADLPGVDPDSIELVIDGCALTIKAQRTPRSRQTADWIATERFAGTFRRQLTLGEAVDAAHIRAGYHNGVLTVTIPTEPH